MVDGGGTPTVPTYFSYKCLETEKKGKLNPVSMNRFLLTNLPYSVLPPGSSIYDDKGRSTNNIAEWAALYFGVRRLKDILGEVPLKVYQDSELIVRQFNGIYQIKKEWLLPWYQATKWMWWESAQLEWVKRDYIVTVLGH
ncbi:hypothetical protein C4588_02060 [Candidatus Parcubacteria bacterium]|nr:MAG: hypothetical protein C4588_02060 [Candidatus Parcubacteria bacterium]